MRLGENSTDVLGEVITKVNEARFELPRDVEDPVVSNRTGGDAMMYLALLSEEMSVQQRADYAMRFIQPVLSTVEGVGEARVLGSGNFAMRIWLNPTKMAAFGVTATDVDDAIRRDNYISAAGTTRGEYVRASVDAQTDLEDPERFAEIVVRQDGDRRVTARRCRERRARERNVRIGRVLERQGDGLHRDHRSAGRESARDDGAREGEGEGAQHAAARRHVDLHGRGRVDLHPRGAERSDAHADRSVADRRAGDFPVPRIAARGRDPDRRDSAVARHGAVSDLDDGVLDQSADAARDGDRDRARGGRCDRGRRERAPSHRRRQTTVRCRAHGRARSGDAGDRDDAHARRGVSADRFPRRTHGCALQRIRADARGRGGRLRRDRAGAVAR